MCITPLLFHSTPYPFGLPLHALASVMIGYVCEHNTSCGMPSLYDSSPMQNINAEQQSAKAQVAEYLRTSHSRTNNRASIEPFPSLQSAFFAVPARLQVAVQLLRQPLMCCGALFHADHVQNCAC